MPQRYIHLVLLALVATTLSLGCGSSERRGTPTGNDDVNLPDAGDDTTSPSTDELFAEFFARLQFTVSGERDYNCRCYPEEFGYSSTQECLDEHEPLPDDFVETMEACFNEELEVYINPEDDLVAPLRTLLLTGLDALDDEAVCMESARQATECNAANDEAFSLCEDQRAATIAAAEEDAPAGVSDWLNDAANMLYASSCLDLIP
ncbi:hypothetical protein FRC98_11120 [Lujinxingia vulgaris]|uniref:Uncharacterized protein n=1 Tax=Lujinxingia vulgaris TaxID=2600176 RepID=A0A5C6X7K1_9DELT|nr:hypothetical protein [Lujinxingia vulgaris]TXD37274.1 hypothetical protein FRC98_11120 [Lujinxingia vulgaris]